MHRIRREGKLIEANETLRLQAGDVVAVIEEHCRPPPGWLAAIRAAFEPGDVALLVLGLGTRIITVPLMITMLVAIFAVHWDYGWAAIADSGSSEIAVRLGTAKDILMEHGNYAWLSEKGSLVILNNGIEFAVTYLIMLLSLLFTGGGRYVSLDYYLPRLIPDRD